MSQHLYIFSDYKSARYFTFFSKLSHSYYFNFLMWSALLNSLLTYSSCHFTHGRQLNKWTAAGWLEILTRLIICQPAELDISLVKLNLQFPSSNLYLQLPFSSSPRARFLVRFNWNSWWEVLRTSLRCLLIFSLEISFNRHIQSVNRNCYVI